jgi:predicted metal-binding membrane protein
MTPLAAARKHPEVIAGTLVAAALAWWWTVERMAGMDTAPGGSLGTPGWFMGSWILMMAAMMLPSFAPNVAAYATLTRGCGPGRPLLFACGYLLAWTAAGLLAYGAFELGKQFLSTELSWNDGGRWLAGAVIAAAAAYQFTPAKHACLARCRRQLGRSRGASGAGTPAALELGARGGGWCIGCSWALMATLFALGVMSLTWMALIAGLVALEKTGPRPRAAKLATASVLALLAAGVLLAPAHVPGLVVPGAAPMHAMNAMG